MKGDTVQTIAASAVDRAVAIGEQRERNRLRVFVKTLPTSYEDGLWVKTQVLRFLDEVAADRPGSESPTAAASAPFSGPEQPAAAAPALGGHAVAARSG